MKILICGDSFAADYTVKYKDGEGWPNKLAKIHTVTNLAQAGCSEYKILQQLKTVKLSKFDTIIVSHTSPFRLVVKEHPVHHKDKLHKNCDLIYTDIKEHSETDSSLLPIVEYFEQYFDMDYARYVHNLICKEIDMLLKDYKVIHITNLDYTNLYEFNNLLNFEQLFETNRGLFNHYDDEGNQFIFDTIVKHL